MSDRDLVLGRIRAALGTGQPSAAAVPREYRSAGEHPAGSPALLDLLADRLEDYHATVYRCRTDGIAQAVAAALDRALAECPGPGTVVTAAGLPAGWMTLWAGRAVSDPDPDGNPLPVEVLDGVDGVVTSSAIAIAETGTIVLDGSPDQGRRAVSLVPDLHLVVVLAGQVVQTVPEALARLDPTRPLTMISGPSATSDIELDRVEGVHGPRRLLVLLVAGD